MAVECVLPHPLHTPLLRDGTLWIKPEGRQRTHSVKYRLVHARLCRALAAGEIPPGTTLIEATSGSTGVALAHAGRLLGAPVELHASRSIEPAKREKIERAGARLVLHEAEVRLSDVLAEIARKVGAGGYWHLGQYDRASLQGAYRALADEVVLQVRATKAKPPAAFVCPVGTGGLIQGVGGALRSAFPGMRIIAVEPTPDSPIDGMRNTDVLHFGDDDPYDRAFPDEVARVPRPGRTSSVRGIRLGQSASAAYDLARSGGWSSALLIAPD